MPDILFKQLFKCVLNPLMAIFPGVYYRSAVGNISSSHSTKSDIEHKKIGGLETNHKCMSIIIAQKCL